MYQKSFFLYKSTDEHFSHAKNMIACRNWNYRLTFWNHHQGSVLSFIMDTCCTAVYFFFFLSFGLSFHCSVHLIITIPATCWHQLLNFYHASNRASLLNCILSFIVYKYLEKVIDYRWGTKNIELVNDVLKFFSDAPVRLENRQIIVSLLVVSTPSVAEPCML